MAKEQMERLVPSDGAIIGIRGYERNTFARFAGVQTTGGMVAMACQVEQPLAVMAQSRPVLSMDMRGQIIRGSRVENEDEVTIEQYIADFENVRESLGQEKLAVLGYSPGGFFAAHYALAKPERISALVLAEPAIYTETEDLYQRAELAERGDGVRAMEAMLTYIDPSISPEERNRLANIVVRDWQSPKMLGKVFRLHGDRQLTDSDLAGLSKVPLLLIGGSESPMNFHIKRLAAAVPSAYVWWIQGASHLDLMDPPYAEEIAAVTSRFLDSVGAR
ncbi:MAG TPA: alpha/beta fold hydrolase [Longimicrobiaceae bacterium]